MVADRRKVPGSGDVHLAYGDSGLETAGSRISPAIRHQQSGKALSGWRTTGRTDLGMDRERLEDPDPGQLLADGDGMAGAGSFAWTRIASDPSGFSRHGVVRLRCNDRRSRHWRPHPAGGKRAFGHRVTATAGLYVDDLEERRIV